MSEIFERLKLLQPHLAKSRTALAETLGVDVSTFSGLLRRQSNNIYPLLPKIFELLPDLSAEWLYLGKGSMFDSADKPEEGNAAHLAARIQELTQANAQLTEANKQLLEQNGKLIDQNQELIGQLLKQNLK